MIDGAFSYLVMAESRQFFTSMSSYVLSKRSQHLYTVCPSDMVLKTAGEQNCLIALFLGQMDIVLKKCKRLMLNEPSEPVWIRSPDVNYWFIVLALPHVTVQCQATGPPQTSMSNYQKTLDGT
jgi:hypothetical protein